MVMDRLFSFTRVIAPITVFLTLTPVALSAAQDPSAAVAPEAVAWWVWPLVLLVLTFFMGILAALGGIGGGVLYVPIVSGFFPFHLDRTNVLEIPTTVPEDWDLELSGCSPDQASRRQIDAISHLKQRGGIANICTHPEPQMTLRPEWLQSHARVLEWLADDDEVWVARPGDIDRHWRRRQAEIDTIWQHASAQLVA